MEILQAVNLRKYYQSGDNTVKAVDDISFSIEKGSFTAVVGTSGSGKTGADEKGYKEYRKIIKISLRLSNSWQDY